MIRYRRSSKALTGKLQDEIVMMDLEQGKYFSLNQVATRIWDILEQSMTQDDLCRTLISEYEVSQEQCQAEVSEYLSEMVKMGLLIEE